MCFFQDPLVLKNSHKMFTVERESEVVFYLAVNVIKYSAWRLLLFFFLTFLELYNVNI